METKTWSQLNTVQKGFAVVCILVLLSLIPYYWMKYVPASPELSPTAPKLSELTSDGERWQAFYVRVGVENVPGNWNVPEKISPTVQDPGLDRYTIFIHPELSDEKLLALYKQFAQIDAHKDVDISKVLAEDPLRGNRYWIIVDVNRETGATSVILPVTNRPLTVREGMILAAKETLSKKDYSQINMTLSCGSSQVSTALGMESVRIRIFGTYIDDPKGVAPQLCQVYVRRDISTVATSATTQPSVH